MSLRPVLLLLGFLPLRNCFDACESSLLQTRSSHAQGVQCPGLKQPVARAGAPRSFDSWNNGSSSLYVNQEHNFAFCMIPKNAVSQWSKLLTRLEYMNPKINHADYFLAEEMWSAHKAWNIFSSKAATRAVFLRDPLERFLSAFLNKCTDTCHSGFCLSRGTKAMAHAPPPSFREAVSWVGSLGPEAVMNLDSHWKPQAYHCDLHERIHDYTDVGLMQLGNLAESAGCLLKKAGLGWLDVDGENFSESFWHEANKFVEHDTAHLLKQYYTPEAAATVMQAFKVDYDLLDELQFPRPQWIQDATGEKIDVKKCGGGRKEGVE